MNILETSLKNLGYSVKEVSDNVLLIKNFLQNSEIEEISKQILSATDEDWTTHYMNGVIGLAERKYGRTDIDNLVEEGLIEITNHWIDKNLQLSNDISETISQRIKDIFSFSPMLKFDGVGTIQRQYAGAPLIEHVDNYSDPLIEYAVIMYINDDYIDGELFFPNLNFQIRPPAKSMIIFPSGEKYLHGVKSPGAGPIRYVLPSFVRRVVNNA